MLRSFDELFVPLYRRLPAQWQIKTKAAYVRALSIGIGAWPNPLFSEDEVTATQELSIIVPVFNAPLETERCLRSLERFAGKAEVIIIDDGSTDQRASAVIRDYASRNAWITRHNRRNSYHSGACMGGALLATRPILCFLNSDTVVTQHSWSLCIRALRHEPLLMAVGPRTSAGLISQTDRRAALCRNVWREEQIFWYAERLFRRYRHRAPRVVEPPVSGSALFLRRLDWERVGGFSECRPHYGNDSDLCRKLTACGGRVAICDGAYVHHLGGCSAGPP
ncbi:glycosyltransferase [uncultured Thiodictyon sp.]|jgi:GT2 family glycosyltransferase|uniref:glycosyltransferase family 2 protein n=1 Tax=uncultured Thiodictyon sp. TaxID=1846217 RepID=UPI0025FAAA0B|nr:glycosyltransferase [uncultured Thiodictyon sp.]